MEVEVNREKLKQFIQEVLDEGKFEGCRYKYIDAEYALVFAWLPVEEIDGEEKYTLCGKIARNIDDLTCDYDWDWEMPCWDGTRDIFDTDMGNCEDLSANWLAEIFELDYNNLTKKKKQSK